MNRDLPLDAKTNEPSLKERPWMKRVLLVEFVALLMFGALSAQAAEPPPKSTPRPEIDHTLTKPDPNELRFPERPSTPPPKPPREPGEIIRF